MRFLIPCLCAALLGPLFPGAARAAGPDSLRNGDLIFQTSKSAQSQAIQAATHSPYSHCGIVFFDGY